MKLEDQLYLMREQLQEKFYDNKNHRKPIICSDSALDLLEKYKPTSLQDMLNISGIGPLFVENYGEYFLQIINKFKSNEKVEINNDEKIILSKLENRLVNINKRNRLLYSSKINKDFGLDLVKIISNIDDLQKFIINQENGLFKLLNINSDNDDYLKPILRLMRQVNRIGIETGNNELYVAYPFVQGKTENENFNIKAPLILFPVSIERDAESINLKNDNSRDILYNTNLILANNKFNGKNEVLPDNAIEEFKSETYMEDLINFYNDNKFFIKNNECHIEKFLENKANEFPKYKNGELEIKQYIVLGLYSNYVTSMYADFHKMIESNDATKLIQELLYGVEKAEENYDFLYNEEMNTSKIDNNIENEISYINELDFSQELVLKEINKSNAIVVQGPPGTGKSQTITSIISQNILKGKNILMVSEKKTALDVIYSRLGELSRCAILIDDVENKEEFYNQINSISEMVSLDEIFDYQINESKEIALSKIKEKVDAINYELESLNLIADKVYGINNFDTSMYNIYNTCKRVDLNNEIEFNIYSFINDSLSSNINNLTFPELTNIYNEFKEKDKIENLLNYLNIIDNHGVIDNIKTNLVDVELITFKNKLCELNTYLQCFNKLPFYKKVFEKKNLHKILDDIINTFFVTNNSQVAKLLIKDITYLSTFSKNYQNFLSNKYLFDKLNFQEKDYILLINNVCEKFGLSDSESNEKIYNTILYNKICDFEKNYYEILNYINNFDNIRSNIRKNIIEKKEITKKLAFNMLISNLNKLNDNNSLNKIQEMCNRKRKMSVNKFMAKYKFELLDSIKIWLMTPEVVSDILPFEKNIFDLVIFDEASQLYVEKAIPAIYRAKKVIVAGDQKQLKPSSLGQGRILDEIDEDEISDGFLEYESLLDAACYKYKRTMLNYHYRSRYEELIAFSNYAFYNGKLLVTSLANKVDTKPIERIKVENGLWIDKKNEQEANEVVKLLKTILNTRKNNETIGVITFNSSQMNLIEDLIEKEKNVDQQFAILMQSEENRTFNGENISFFVKNIETVQGDERDIIIFCIGYAKNEKGRVAINFGWLNQDGGENRLNVAISRAKEKIYVVTSIEPEELVVDDTKNDGPKLFKKYLEYVKAIDAGNSEYAKQLLYSLLDRNGVSQAQLTFDSTFEEEVCNMLMDRGYNVVTQYGVGGYRIDLVIQSKDGENLLGIECDGRLYHSSKYARERDYHRQKYLESRGWKIYRIWSTNWWKNPELEIEKIVKYIQKTTSGASKSS